MLTLCLLACGSLEPSSTVVTQEQRVPGLSLADPDSIRARRVELGQRLQSDPDPAVRSAIAAALAYTARDVESISVLAAALEVEKEVDVQRRLVATLASFSRQNSVDAIVAFWLRGVALELEGDVLSALGGCNPHQVRASLANHPEADRVRVERALAALRDEAHRCPAPSPSARGPLPGRRRRGTLLRWALKERGIGLRARRPCWGYFSRVLGPG